MAAKCTSSGTRCPSKAFCSVGKLRGRRKRVFFFFSQCFPRRSFLYRLSNLVPRLFSALPVRWAQKRAWVRGYQKAISANPGLKFNRLFILVCSARQLKLKLSKATHFIVSMISEQKFSNIFVYNFVHNISINPGLS